MKKFLTALLYLLAAALLMLAAFPPINFPLAAHLALAPLLLLIVRLHQLRTVFWSCFSLGFLFFAGLLYWLPRAMERYGGVHFLVTVSAWLATCLILAVFVGAFALVMRLLWRAWSWPALLLAPPAWVALELARNYLVLTGFPWGVLGASQVPFGPLIQIADITGVYGVSFIPALSGTAAAIVLAKGASRRLKFVSVALAVGVVAGALGYGELRQRTLTPHRGETLEVALFQGNLMQEDGWFQATDAHLHLYPRLLGEMKAVHPGLRLAIFPENPAPLSYDEDLEYRALLQNMARSNGVTLMVNGNRAVSDNGYTNTLYCLGPDGELSSTYDKVRLVPFAETVPFARVFFFARSLSQEIGDFRPGTNMTIHHAGNMRVGAFICYEAVFPEHVRQFTARGAQLLVNVTNDAWFGPTAAPYQHFQFSILRAVENRRWLLRVANSGISAIIDPFGRVVRSTELFKKDMLWGQVTALDERSPYVIMGDAFAWICVGTVALFSILAVLAVRRAERGARSQAAK